MITSLSNELPPHQWAYWAAGMCMALSLIATPLLLRWTCRRSRQDISWPSVALTSLVSIGIATILAGGPAFVGALGLPWVIVAEVVIFFVVRKVMRSQHGKGPLWLPALATTSWAVALTICLMFVQEDAFVTARRIRCVSNLSAIAKATQQYVSKWGAPPSELEGLESVGVGYKTLMCPSLRDQSGPSYFYYPQAAGQNAGPWERTLLACDLLGNHVGARMAVNVEGRGYRLDEPEFQRMLAEPQNQAFAEALRKADRRP